MNKPVSQPQPIAPLHHASLSASGIAHGFFTRQGGVSTDVYTSLNGGVGSQDRLEDVLENRARMARNIGISPDRLLVPYQIHSTDVVAVSEPWAADARPRADGLVTRTRQLGLGTTGADCGMILFADAENQVIGACHSGWKGALNDIPGATVKAMIALGAKASAISAVLGPCIHQPSYEVGPEFISHFLAQSKSHASFFKPSAKENHFHFDLPGFIQMRAGEAGIKFESLGLDTYADEERFFSFRRTTHKQEPDYGRLVSAIALV